MKTYYRAPWETRVKIITAFVIILLVGVSIAPLLIKTDLPAIATLLSVLVPSGILLISGLFAVRGYSLTDKAVIVHHPLWTRSFLLEDLQEAYSDPFAMQGSLRLFGIGGLFGFIGYFQNRELGRYQAYVTDMQRNVILKFKQGIIVISPHNPGSFLKELDTYVDLPVAQ